VITISMSALVHAPRSRVWRALVDPSEIMRWDARALELRGEAPDYPSPGKPVRWRYRVGSVPIELRDTALEVVPEQRLRLARSFGSLRFEETFSLGDEVSGSETRLALRLAVANSVPTLGGALDRFDVRRFASELVDESLRALQKWCEQPPATDER
jgi:uncharacterized protein YndB with AHSA1/START domain